MAENSNNVVVGPGPGTPHLGAYDVGINGRPASRGAAATQNVAPNPTGPISNIPLFEAAVGSNILHNYRSFNYLFTLACIKRDSLLDPDSLRDSEDYYLVAKSSGKGNAVMREDVEYTADEITKRNNTVSDSNLQPEDAGRIIDTLASYRDVRKKLVEGFNKNSSGRFDFFIDNLEIDSVMGGNTKTNMSIATNITFDVYEPYSINGFLETLQVSAVAAGHVNYITAPYLLKVEFIGHPDNQQTNSLGEKIGKQGSRYFVIVFTKVDVEMTNEGTVYRCAATPFSERGYADSVNKFKTSTQVFGNTVKEILTNLETELNNAEQSSAKKLYGDDKNYDKYEIRFPSTNSQGLDFSVENEISKSKVGELLKSTHTYHYTDFPESFTPTIVVSDNSNIHEAIILVLRDSEYTKNLVAESLKPNSKVIDDLGFVTYFSVNIEVIPQTTWNNKLNRPFYTYRYLVVPYKLHYTRIPLLKNKTVNTNSLRSIVAREYNYIYTGNNVDILNFNLKFNHLYFQGVPTYLGNAPLFSSQVGIQPSPSVDIRLASISEEEQLQRNIPTSPVRVDLRNNNIQIAGGTTAPRDFSDPYDAMVKNFHQAILDNLDMVEASVRILGDPYYLLDGGISNYYPKLVTPALTVDGQAPQYFNDVFINLNFRNPFDIDPGTGQYVFSDQNKLTPFSGIFRVIEITSRFSGGLFEQELKLIRVPGQIIDTGKTPEKPAVVQETVKSETPAPARTAPRPQTSTNPAGISTPATTFPVRPGGPIETKSLDLSSVSLPTKLNEGLAEMNQAAGTVQRSAADIRASGKPITQEQAGVLASASILNRLGLGGSTSELSNSVNFKFGNKNSTNPLQQFLNKRS